MSRAAHTTARLGFAAAAVVAVTYQFASLKVGLPTFNPGNFFSFFTIQSNLLAIATLCLVAVVPPAERTLLFDVCRGAATLYIATTGVVFALLLAGLQESLDTHIAWVDFTVHKLLPVVLVVDWVLDPPRHRISPRLSAVWLVYPFLYLVYTLVRGSAEDWYPYPFLDVGRHGYTRVLVGCVVMLAGMLAAIAAFVTIGNRRARSNC